MRSWELTFGLDPGHTNPCSFPAPFRLGRGAWVHRSTVLAGYSELSSQGWPQPHPAGETFVARDLPFIL
jgi:hypothetical protein